MTDPSIEASVEATLAKLTLTERVGQLNQRLYGWRAVRRGPQGWEPTEELSAEIESWNGLGAIYGLFRADGWSGRDWSNGILPEERAEVAAMVTDLVVAASPADVPPLIVEEAPHGQLALGATGFPVSLNIGATWDPELYAECSRAVAAELRESGVHLALVSTLDILRDPRWGRAEECFGEDPVLSSALCRAVVEGMQGVSRSRLRDGTGVGVVLKHFAAQGEALGGRNGRSATIGPRDLAEIHLPAAHEGVRAGAVAVMAAYNDIDGVPCCSNPALLTDLLRGDWGFDGLVMADGLAIDRLIDMTGSPMKAAVVALEAGVDLSLWDESFALLEEAARSVPSVAAAIENAARRVLRVKAELGLLDAIRPPSPPADRRHSIRLSQMIAERSLVLLTNDGTLPLASLAREAPNTPPAPRPSAPVKIAVVGPFAGSITSLLGDYSPPLHVGVTGSIVDELRRATRGRALVTDHSDSDRLVRDADVVVAVIGGSSHRSYTDAFADNGALAGEGTGEATCGEGVDRASIDLPHGQDALISHLREVTDAPIVCVVVAGRPHMLARICAESNAVLLAGYPGPFGAAAIADMLIGAVEPSGRLSFTLPAAASVVPLRYNDRQTADEVYQDVPFPVLFPFGHGLGYHSPLRETLAAELDPDADSVHVTVTLTSDNPQDVAHTVQIYVRRHGGITWPRRRELIAFRRVIVPADDTVTTTFSLTPASVFAERAGADAYSQLYTSVDAPHPPGGPTSGSTVTVTMTGLPRLS